MESSQLVTSPSLGGNAYSNNRPSSPNGSVANSIAVSTRSPSQPLTFKSQDLRAALALQEAQSAKIYMEGYLSKRDECGSDGKPLHPNDEKRRWNLCFVQLSGTVMSIWSVKEMDKAAKEGREVPPSYINITDSVSTERRSAGFRSDKERGVANLEEYNGVGNRQTSAHATHFSSNSAEGQELRLILPSSLLPNLFVSVC